jgi:hypothetical protein
LRTALVDSYGFWQERVKCKKAFPLARNGSSKIRHVLNGQLLPPPISVTAGLVTWNYDCPYDDCANPGHQKMIDVQLQLGVFYAASGAAAVTLGPTIGAEFEV